MPYSLSIVLCYSYSLCTVVHKENMWEGFCQQTKGTQSMLNSIRGRMSEMRTNKEYGNLFLITLFNRGMCSNKDKTQFCSFRLWKERKYADKIQQAVLQRQRNWWKILNLLSYKMTGLGIGEHTITSWERFKWDTIRDKWDPNETWEISQWDLFGYSIRSHLFYFFNFVLSTSYVYT